MIQRRYGKIAHGIEQVVGSSQCRLDAMETDTGSHNGLDTLHDLGCSGDSSILGSRKFHDAALNKHVRVNAGTHGSTQSNVQWRQVTFGRYIGAETLL